MLAAVWKLTPQLLCWTGMVVALLRGLQGRRMVVAASGFVGFVLGAVGALLLSMRLSGDFFYGLIRGAVGGCFLLFWVVSVAALYRSTGRASQLSVAEKLVQKPWVPGAAASVAGALAGAVCACSLAGSESRALATLALAAVGGALVLAAVALERRLSPSLGLLLPGLAAAVTALLMYSSSSLVRLDLFSPLSMKVTKFTHDFVHQFFESMLLPDHFFFNSFTWNFIGFFFDKGVGFWGGLVIWFTPVLLVLLAIGLERLPLVSHIRQGAQRRKLLAAAILARRRRLVIPALALVVLAVAVYKSRFPSVEYWDPKPMPIAAGPSGEIFIPRKGEVDLEDGKLHKYLFKRDGREARFFVLMTPEGKLSVDLDACSICKPDGYGQAEGTVICYYCRTLIPLESVGKAGGCNPVPVLFTDKEDGVHIDGPALLNKWGETVQATTRVKEGSK